MKKKILEELSNLINDGIVVKSINFKTPPPGIIMPDYIAGDEFDIWMNKVKLFASRYLKEYPLYNEIIECYNTRNNQWGTNAYDSMMNFMRTIFNDENYWKEEEKVLDEKTNAKSEKVIFISHSSLDIHYVKPFVQLLEDIGLSGKGKIFCSSLSGYWIPKNNNIYDYLKKLFDKNLYMILFLSDNYYESPACMNEMGATWVKVDKPTHILTPEFNFSEIKGSVDTSQIMFKLNNRERINELKDELINEFDLNKLDENFWERKREDFLNTIDSVIKSSKYSNRSQRIDVEDILYWDENTIRCVLRFINKDKTPQICKSLKIMLVDFLDKKVEINIPFHMLREYKIYANENKRITVEIKPSTIEGFEKFNISTYKSWSTESSWSSCID
ncbi:toll/interleukin-1 receptor domain-containing protein [Clostridium hydrogenum]|uniref:toll/interleukin-1 receptor domain-containing protein n=1 Tax=Clostridium hydrogenum TaxID=2855764 RepID=UPI001F2B64CF|nr:toll/interleukin-1 receptor domain-containing protein [Clostridium hydrogenum]